MKFDGNTSLGNLKTSAGKIDRKVNGGQQEACLHDRRTYRFHGYSSDREFPRQVSNPRLARGVEVRCLKIS